MLKDWTLIDKIENRGKNRERVVIRIYSRKDNYSFGVDVDLNDRGLGTPCLEEPYIFSSKQEAVKGAVSYIKNHVETSRDYKEFKNTIFKLLPNTDPDLFGDMLN